MSQRFTKKDAERAFVLLAEDCGARVAYKYNDPGAWRLDYNGTYGGYVIEAVANESGGIFHPFNAERRNARQFWDWCYAIRAGIRIGRDLERETAR